MIEIHFHDFFLYRITQFDLVLHASREQRIKN